jgi:hypothetical protein
MVKSIGRYRMIGHIERTPEFLTRWKPLARAAASR